MTSAVAAVDGVYVVADSKGDVFYVDGNNGGKNAAAWEGKKPVPPLQIACSKGAGVETCVIVDSHGNCWHGPARAVAGQKFRPV